MRVTFRIQYYTDNVLHIRPERGAARSMHRISEGEWQATLELSQGSTYRYEEHSPQGEIIRTESRPHLIESSPSQVELYVQYSKGLSSTILLLNLLHEFCIPAVLTLIS